MNISMMRFRSNKTVIHATGGPHTGLGGAPQLAPERRRSDARSDSSSVVDIGGVTPGRGVRELFASITGAEAGKSSRFLARALRGVTSCRSRLGGGA